MQYLLENDFLKTEISSHGAELRSVIGKSDGYQYLWQGDPQFWDSRAPVLFPIVGNLNEGQYGYGEKRYAMERHGFAAKKEFFLSKEEENSLTFCLEDDPSTLCRYPFQFRLLVTYTLQEKTLTTRFQVENRDHQPLWFSIGGHPALNCSVSPDGRKNGRLVFEKPETIKRLVNESGYMTGREAPFLEGGNAVDIASLDFDGKTKVYILKGLRSESVTLEDRGNLKAVTVRFAGFPYLGIWSPVNQAPFVCIEPWYGITSTQGVSPDLRMKEGILSLAPGQQFRCQYKIVIE